ncbi:MAG: Uma2 family endonuclease [Gemmataceae bacterium]
MAKVPFPPALPGYPESDGRPMADDSLQLEWIFLLQQNLELLCQGEKTSLVAAALLWYATLGDPADREAPDVIVALRRPRGDRRSYYQWVEGTPPHVVFEVMSPHAPAGEIARKFAFYDRHGVEEYYLIDPHSLSLHGWLRREGRFVPVEEMDGWTSPLLGIRFTMTPTRPAVFHPGGERFLTFVEHFRLLQQAEQRRDAARARLRELGIDPDAA